MLDKIAVFLVTAVFMLTAVILRAEEIDISSINRFHIACSTVKEITSDLMISHYIKGCDYDTAVEHVANKFYITKTTVYSGSSESNFSVTN